jgi:DNA-binding HxlR family transcriptional regulator
MSEQKCMAEKVIKLIGGRWKVSILWLLMDGKKRYSEIKKTTKDITEKMLTQQLREMERDNLINRKIYAVIPPKVEYSLTPLGRSLKSILKALTDWGVIHLK